MMQRLLQFTRDLFEPESPAAAGKPVRVESETLKKKKPVIEADGAQYALENVAYSEPVASPLSSQALQQPLAPAAYRHPRATREARLQGILVAYEFRRSQRRSIGFSVGATGLAVSAPKWVALRDIDQALRDKSGWILKKLQETRERHHRLESARIDWKDGAILPFLGESMRVALDSLPGIGGVDAQLKAHADALLLRANIERHNVTNFGVASQALLMSLPRNATPEQIRDMVQLWLMRQAKQLFTERLDHFAPQLGVQWRKLSLSSALTRWGSASADGSIRLNWRLVHFNRSVIDYVVVHELSHLRVMDHSPRFWATVRSVMPDYAALRGQLKDETIPRW